MKKQKKDYSVLNKKMEIFGFKVVGTGMYIKFGDMYDLSASHDGDEAIINNIITRAIEIGEFVKAREVKRVLNIKSD